MSRAIDTLSYGEGAIEIEADPIERDFEVVAEDAPLGVQLWPTISPEYAPRFTLCRVEIVRDPLGEWVRWTYESGQTRHFRKGERVACRLSD